MHRWGDEGVDWAGISAAASYIGRFARTFGRINVMQTKEKYGTVRVYCVFGYTTLHSLIWPGWAYKNRRWPEFMWALDIYFWPVVFKYTGFEWAFIRYQKAIYRVAYKRALKKWPHLRAEILDFPDWPELLEGL